MGTRRSRHRAAGVPAYLIISGDTTFVAQLLRHARPSHRCLVPAGFEQAYKLTRTPKYHGIFIDGSMPQDQIQLLVERTKRYQENAGTAIVVKPGHTAAYPCDFVVEVNGDGRRLKEMFCLLYRLSVLRREAVSLWLARKGCLTLVEHIRSAGSDLEGAPGGNRTSTYHSALQAVERGIIVGCLNQHDHNVKECAAALGISYGTLLRRIKALRIAK